MTRDLIAIASDMALSNAKSLMEESEVHHLPVLDDGRLAGILSRGDVRGAWASEVPSLFHHEHHWLLAGKPVRRFMTPDPVTVAPTATVTDACLRMLEHDIGGLPVVERGQLVGILTTSDLLHCYLDYDRSTRGTSGKMGQQRIGDWMAPDPIKVTPDTSLSAARSLMMRHNLHRLFVMDGHRLLGIVTRGDVRGAEPSEATSLSVREVGYWLDRLPMKEIMSRKVISASVDDLVSRAASVMMANKISGLPVTDNGRIVGIISVADILHMVAQEWKAEDPALSVLEPSLPEIAG
jgi:CBS domain-containing protein